MKMKLVTFSALFFVFILCVNSQNIDMNKAYRCTGIISEYGSKISDSYCQFVQQGNNLTIKFSPDGTNAYTADCQKNASDYTVIGYNGVAQSGSLTLRKIHHAGSSGGTYVKGYTRKNGTRVSGYWRGGGPSPAIDGFELKLSLTGKAAVSYYFVQ
jgi:hypothetical protein